MRIALANPNRLRRPPVIPLGLEYLTHAIRGAGHEVRAHDLCFSEHVERDLDEFLRDYKPDVAFLSIRNVDSAVRAEVDFHLDAHAAIAARIVDAGVRLIVGGAGVPAMPEAIRRILRADCVVVGPGEGAALRAIEVLAAGRELPPIVNGFDVPFDASAVPARAVDFDYAAYYAAEGVAGFASSYGCPCRCAFCIEARTGVRYRAPAAVAAEVRSLVEKGWQRMHLCDAEMNISYDHALALCKAMVGTGATWMTYMRHKPFDAALAAALRESNCELATVTVNSATDRPEDAADCVRLLRAEGVRVAVDLSCGLPGETPDPAKAMIEALEKARPERVGINSRFRVYPTAPLAEFLRENPEERRFVTGDPEFIRPAVYCRFDPAEVQQWIAGREGFAIDIGEAVNYQRLGR